jgi:hypothetical protein
VPGAGRRARGAPDSARRRALTPDMPGAQTQGCAICHGGWRSSRGPAGGGARQLGCFFSRGACICFGGGGLYLNYILYTQQWRAHSRRITRITHLPPLLVALVGVAPPLITPPAPPVARGRGPWPVAVACYLLYAQAAWA